jgi:hypothetical protein
MALTTNGKDPSRIKLRKHTKLRCLRSLQYFFNFWKFWEMLAVKSTKVLSGISKDLASFPMLPDSAKHQISQWSLLCHGISWAEELRIPQSSSMELSPFKCFHPVIYTGIFDPNLFREWVMGCMGWKETHNMVLAAIGCAKRLEEMTWMTYTAGDDAW